DRVSTGDRCGEDEVGGFGAPHRPHLPVGRGHSRGGDDRGARLGAADDGAPQRGGMTVAVGLVGKNGRVAPVDTNPPARPPGTRSPLVGVGREVFAERCFGATSTEDIVQRAGVTRGALYYHFRDKQDLFRAVFAAVEEDIHRHVTAAAVAEGDPWGGLVGGCL